MILMLRGSSCATCLRSLWSTEIATARVMSQNGFWSASGLDDQENRVHGLVIFLYYMPVAFQCPSKLTLFRFELSLGSQV